MSKAIDDDISNTLKELYTFLLYSTDSRAQEISQIIFRAIAAWENE